MSVGAAVGDAVVEISRGARVGVGVGRNAAAAPLARSSILERYIIASTEEKYRNGKDMIQRWRGVETINKKLVQPKFEFRVIESKFLEL